MQSYFSMTRANHYAPAHQETKAQRRLPLFIVSRSRINVPRSPFIPPHNGLHSKSVSFSLVFFLNIKFDLLVFGNTILQGGLCFVGCVESKKILLSLLNITYSLMLTSDRSSFTISIISGGNPAFADKSAIIDCV